MGSGWCRNPRWVIWLNGCAQKCDQDQCQELNRVCKEAGSSFGIPCPVGRGRDLG